MKQKDIFYMKKAIKLSKKGEYTTDPNPNVGCVIVKKKKIVGIGWHEKYGTNHAEVNAINMAGKLAKNGTAYVSLEPCNHFGKTPPCCQAIVKSGIKRVVISSMDPNPKVSGKGVKFLKKSGILITTGILKKQSEYINRGFLKRMKTGLPWIQLKLAISIDGRTAMKNGESKWITSNHARKDVHKFRSKSSAIISTSNTILTDNPLLTARYKIKNNDKIKQPIRIIVDSQNRVKPYHNLIKQTEKIWLIRLKKDNETWPNHVQQILIPSYKKKINLIKLFYMLGKKEINTIWIESGSIFFSKILNLGIADEIIFYIATKMLGDTGKPSFITNKITNLKNVPNFRLEKIKRIGPDIKIILKPYIKNQ
ncbi:Riboflavin biosynthesis protein RibD [Buchnera aphidicola (Symydobius americanus)]